MRSSGFTGLDLNKAKELNRRLFEYLPPEDIVMDLTTVALGYGLEYSFSIHERARHAALMGDEELQQPTISAASNSWVAREARMKMDPGHGPREFRGPLWETINALTLMLAGVDIFMVAHPTTIKTLKDIMQMLVRKDVVLQSGQEMRWSTARIWEEFVCLRLNERKASKRSAPSTCTNYSRRRTAASAMKRIA